MSVVIAQIPDVEASVSDQAGPIVPEENRQMEWLDTGRVCRKWKRFNIVYPQFLKTSEIEFARLEN